MSDMTTTYLGIRLRCPLVASSSPLTGDLDHLVALDAAGIGAVVLPSLFEEQLVSDSLAVHGWLEEGAGAFGEATTGYVPELDDYNTGPGNYLRQVEAAKKRIEVPVIASLNGDTPGGWVRYARLLADAGADAIELNVYRLAADPSTTGRAVEQEVIQLVSEVRTAVGVPIAVKLSPFWSALGSFAGQLAAAGANGLVLFNRFYQPDIDLETLDVSPSLHLSSAQEMRLPLRWVAMLYGHVKGSLAVTTGVLGWREVAKALLAGADVAMMASALLRHGPEHVATTLDGLQRWLEAGDYESVDQLRGALSYAAVADPSGYERANYLQTLSHYSTVWK